MKSKPPITTKKNPSKKLQNFIAEAEPNEAHKNIFPWENATDKTKVFNLRLSEKHFLMLKFLAENTNRASMQSICLDKLEPILEKESKSLFNKLKD